MPWLWCSMRSTTEGAWGWLPPLLLLHAGLLREVAQRVGIECCHQLILVCVLCSRILLCTSCLKTLAWFCCITPPEETAFIATRTTLPCTPLHGGRRSYRSRLQGQQALAVAVALALWTCHDVII